MVLFVPILILLLFSIGIQILGRTRINITQSWIFAIIGSVLAWLSFIIIKVFASGQSVTSFYTSGTSINFQIIFQINDKNWVFGFLWLTLLIPILIMDSRRIIEKNNLNTWSGSLLIVASALLAIMSGSVIAFLLVSALLDVQIFASRISTLTEGLEVRRTIFEILVRMTGTLFIMFGFGENGEFDLLLTSVGLALRFGVVPLASEISATAPVKTNLATLLELAVPITCFAYMNQMQVMKAEFQGKSFLLLVLIIFVFSNIMKITTKQRLYDGFRAWVSAFSGLGVMLFINGQINSMQPLAIVFCVLAGLYSFDLSGSSRLKIAIIVLMLSMIGLPYSPSYGIWLTNSTQGITFFLFFYHVLLTFFLLVVFHAIISMPGNNDKKETWLVITTTISPIILLISPWIFEIWIWPIESNDLNLLSPGLFLAILTFLIYFDRSEKIQYFFHNYLNSKKRILNYIKVGFEKMLSLAWISWGVKIVNQALSRLINIFVRVLEGDGGLLWAFVFLILISSILLTYRIIS